MNKLKEYMWKRNIYICDEEGLSGWASVIGGIILIAIILLAGAIETGQLM